MTYPKVCLVIAFWNVCRLSSQCYCALSVLFLYHRFKQMRCYCSISWINNRRFSSQNNPPAWAIHSLKSIHSHSILLHTDIYRLGISLCYSATSSIIGKSVRHLEWIRNSCYCIEVLPRARETFPRYWPFVRGIHRSPVNSPHKGQWCGVLMFSLICAWINGWVNNGEDGDLRRHRAHYYDTVMIKAYSLYVEHGAIVIYIVICINGPLWWKSVKCRIPLTKGQTYMFSLSFVEQYVE